MDSSLEASRSRRSASRPRKHLPKPPAKQLADALMQHASPLNLDLKATVAGYTHRGGFKLKIENIENLSDHLMDEWKSKCLALAFKPTITYDVTTSTATLHATRMQESTAPRHTNCFRTGNVLRPHPLTAVAVVLVAMNFIRHVLS